MNNFFNPRTAGAQKHPQRERISTHHFQHGEILSPHSTAASGAGSGAHPVSPGGSIGGGSNSRVGGASYQGDSLNHQHPSGGIFLKNTFSPRMKIGQPPGSSGLGSSVGGLNTSGTQGHSSSHHGQYQMGGLSGPVKAHHNRAGMGGQHHHGRSSGGAAGGSLDDSRQSPQNSNHGNNQSFNSHGLAHSGGSGGGFI